MRLALTIAFNAVHHLRSGWVERALPLIDRWVFVEGAAGNGGSTAWCAGVGAEWHDGHGHSNDGTLQWLLRLLPSWGDRVLIGSSPEVWPSKDAMVNHGLEMLRMAGAGSGWLWQFDADESIDPGAIPQVEERVTAAGATCAAFFLNQWVGPNLLARGEWGERASGNGTRRLWRWGGEDFLTHEPPVFGRHETPLIIEDIRIEHRSYVHPKDIRFKEQYYGDTGLMHRWLRLQQGPVFPQPISALLGANNAWSASDTQIVRV